MKNSNDTIGNRSRDLPACSAMPQPTAPQRSSDATCTDKAIPLEKKNRRNVNAFSGTDMTIADSVGQGGLQTYRVPKFIVGSFGLDFTFF